jgi:hypothetical protein
MKEKMAEDAVSNTIIAMCSIEFFSFSFYNFFTSILQKYMVKKNCKTIHLTSWGTAVGPTAVPHGGRNVLHRGARLKGSSLFSKICNFLFKLG